MNTLCTIGLILGASLLLASGGAWVFGAVVFSCALLGKALIEMAAKCRLEFLEGKLAVLERQLAEEGESEEELFFKADNALDEAINKILEEL